MQAAARLGKRLLVKGEEAGFSQDDSMARVDRDQVMFADVVPDAWLFRRASCVIHQGGIGSIAQALRCGCPQLIAPSGKNQFYNAKRAAMLNLGLAVNFLETDVERLTWALQNILNTPDFRQNARLMENRVVGEDGLGTACDMIDRYLGRLSPDRTLPRIYERFSPPLTPRKMTGLVSFFPPRSMAQGRMPSITATDLSSNRIPKIIHQTWKTGDLPPDMAAFRATWVKHHQTWKHLLWTDTENRRFLGQHHSWFLPIYDGYPEAIMRADAVRYFLLYHYGGLYADLDMECLRPMDPFISEKGLILGLEPAEHLKTEDSRARGFTRIVGNALMGSTPGHPFWEHVFKLLVEFHKAPGPLDATGPYMLTRALDSYPHATQRREIGFILPPGGLMQYNRRSAVVRGRTERTP